MFKEYVKHKLTSKLEVYLKSQSIRHNGVNNSVLKKVESFSNYKIKCNSYSVNDIIKIDDSHRIEVSAGKYIILNRDGTYNEQLFSSEFIEFNKTEYREFILASILK